MVSYHALNTEYRIVYSAIKHHTMFIAYNSIVRCTFTENQNKFHVNDNLYNKINTETKNNIFT